MSLIEQNCVWFVNANQMPAAPTPNVKQIAFYIGMQCEELAEKLRVVLHDSPVIDYVDALGKEFKAGNFNTNVAETLDYPDRCKELLDGDIDLLWVTVGAAQAQGADVLGAYGEVNDANWRKRWPDGEFHNDPKTGKVLKPDGWVGPDLTQFLHPLLRGPATE